MDKDAGQAAESMDYRVSSVRDALLLLADTIASSMDGDVGQKDLELVALRMLVPVHHAALGKSLSLEELGLLSPWTVDFKMGKSRL